MDLISDTLSASLALTLAVTTRVMTIDARRAIMLITTNSSIKVNPFLPMLSKFTSSVCSESKFSYNMEHRALKFITIILSTSYVIPKERKSHKINLM